MATDMNKFLEINEGRVMVMANRIDDEGNICVADNTLTLGGYQFVKRNSNGTYTLFDVDPISLNINRVTVNRATLSNAILDILG